MVSSRRPFLLARVSARQDGMALAAVNIVLLVTALSLLVVAASARQERQRLRETELLFIGAQFAWAIESYAKPIDGGGIQFPNDLKELLLDSRSGVERRHLRRIYDDPMTGTNNWGVIRDARGIVGVHSTSQSAPLRKAGFSAPQDFFRNARGYHEWVFGAPQPAPKPE
jgi:type II secretory pathway pseudopilin PulG